MISIFMNIDINISRRAYPGPENVLEAHLLARGDSNSNSNSDSNSNSNSSSSSSSSIVEYIIS